jgi:hypothetical protein
MMLIFGGWKHKYHKEKPKTLLSTSKEVVLLLDVSTNKTKYIFITYHQNAGQNHNIKLDNKSFKKVAKFKYLEKKVTNKNSFLKKLRVDLLLPFS